LPKKHGNRELPIFGNYDVRYFGPQAASIPMNPVTPGGGLAEIGDLARRAPAGAYHLLSCRVRGLLPCGRPGGCAAVFVSGRR
jgi:hypothetical protein